MSNTDPQQRVMAFTRTDAQLFIEAYNIATRYNAEQFKFRKQIFVTAYAKYLAEFLTDKFQLK